MGSLLSGWTASSSPNSNFRDNLKQPLKAEAGEHFENQETTGHRAAKLLKLSTEHMPTEIFEKLVKIKALPWH